MWEGSLCGVAQLRYGYFIGAAISRAREVLGSATTANGYGYSKALIGKTCFRVPSVDIASHYGFH